MKIITKPDYLNYIEKLLERMRQDDSDIDMAYAEDMLPGDIDLHGRHRRLTVHWVEHSEASKETNIQLKDDSA